MLLNIALHGLEAAAGVRYFPAGMAHGGGSVPGTPVVVRYADDLVAMCTSREHADMVKEQLAQWLGPRGLTFNEDKTRIVGVDEGFDFLGFNIRRYNNGKLLIKPSKAAVMRIRGRLAAEVKALHGANAEAVITCLNPVIRGWAAYYRGGVSKEIFSALDHYMWRLTYRWALRTHPNKAKRWVKARYFDAFHPSRRDHWVFGDRDTGRYLVKFSWTPIVRHRMVKGASSPDDPTLAAYWRARRRRGYPPVGPFLGRLLVSQQGRCPVCGDLLLYAGSPPQSPEQWEQWHKAIRAALHHKAVATDNTATDHIAVIKGALAQLPDHRRGKRAGRKVLIRTDSAGCTHKVLTWMSNQRLSYSVGFPLPHNTSELLELIPADVWTPAYDAHDQIRDGAWVAELTGLLDMSRWPEGMRVIARKERPHPGAQLRITDVDGHRVTAFATNTRTGGPATQLPDLELRHRRRARCEDRIRISKDTGLMNLPLQGSTKTGSGAPSWLWPWRSPPGCRCSP